MPCASGRGGPRPKACLNLGPPLLPIMQSASKRLDPGQGPAAGPVRRKASPEAGGMKPTQPCLASRTDFRRLPALPAMAVAAQLDLAASQLKLKPLARLEQRRKRLTLVWSGPISLTRSPLRQWAERPAPRHGDGSAKPLEPHTRESCNKASSYPIGLRLSCGAIGACLIPWRPWAELVNCNASP